MKKIVRKMFDRLGLEVRLRRSDAQALRTSIRESCELLKKLDFRPASVIDVGVAAGTPELYENFADAAFLLVEPLQEFEPQLISILERYRGSYVLAAAGARAGEATFNVHEGHLDGSSLYKESMGAEADGFERTVPVVRLDEVLRERALEGPYLVKIDAQGAELDVLEGLSGALPDTEAIVLEVSLFAFMKEAPEFSDVVSYMKDRGFVAWDIVLGWNRPLDGALGQVDSVFVREHGMLRRSHAYSTREQLKDLQG